MLHLQRALNSANQAVAELQTVSVPDRFLDRYRLLERASRSIQRAHIQLVALIQSQGGIDPMIIAKYNEALENVRGPVERAVEEKNEVVRQAGAGPGDETPTLPPRAVVPTTLGFAPGIFQAISQLPRFVPAAQIRFERNGQLGTLQDAISWYQLDLQREQQLRTGLQAPIGAVAVIFIIAGVVFLGWQVAQTFRTKYTEAVNLEAERAAAERASTAARVAEAMTGTARDVFASCANTAKTVDQVLKCADKAAQVAAKTAEATERAKPEEPKKGLGFFGWVGVITVVGLGAVGGFLLYRYVRTRQARVAYAPAR